MVKQVPAPSLLPACCIWLHFLRKWVIHGLHEMRQIHEMSCGIAGDNDWQVRSMPFPFCVFFVLSTVYPPSDRVYSADILKAHRTWRSGVSLRGSWALEGAELKSGPFGGPVWPIAIYSPMGSWCRPSPICQGWFQVGEFILAFSSAFWFSTHRIAQLQFWASASNLIQLLSSES